MIHIEDETFTKKHLNASIVINIVVLFLISSLILRIRGLSQFKISSIGANYRKIRNCFSFYSLYTQIYSTFLSRRHILRTRMNII